MPPSSGYLQDLSELLDDSLLPINQPDSALTDDSIPRTAPSAPSGNLTGLTSSTFFALLQLDGAKKQPPLVPPQQSKAEDRYTAHLKPPTIQLIDDSEFTFTLGAVDTQPTYNPDIAELVEGSLFAPGREAKRSYSVDIAELVEGSLFPPRTEVETSSNIDTLGELTGDIQSTGTLNTARSKSAFTLDGSKDFLDISPISSTFSNLWFASTTNRQQHLSPNSSVHTTLSRTQSFILPPQPPPFHPTSSEVNTLKLDSLRVTIPKAETPESDKVRMETPKLSLSIFSRLTSRLTPTLPTRTEADVIAELRSNHEVAKHILVKRHHSSITSETSSSIGLSEYDHGLVDAGLTQGNEYGLDESEDENQPESRPRKITERRLRQTAIAERHLQERNERILKEGPKIKKARQEVDESQSTRYLVNQSENRQIISSPREYQTELFERAKDRNIIAVLDTGSGKTLIAVLLLRHIFGQELEDRAVGKPHRISLFLVDSVQLVFQQHAVLKANLDQPMDMFCGEMHCDLWKKEVWEKHFAKNMVIVCTAEVLRQCLHHNFISIDRINLLVFDEAHHAKKDHAYARIIKDFYIPHKQGKDAVVPKIFGMTASPVDARTDVRKAAAELEVLLDCQIATANIKSDAGNEAMKTSEHLATYNPLGPKTETPLFKQMHERFKSSPVLSKPLGFAFQASQELGLWCSDQVWLFCLTEEEATKLQAKTERKYHAKKTQEPLAALEKRKTDIQEARAIVKLHVFEPPDLTVDIIRRGEGSKNLSSKILVLIKYLKERFQRPTDDKCIVFVRQRYTARLLASLFSHPGVGTPHLFVGTLVGTRAGEAGDLNVSFREQVLTMMNFRKGIINCLFATSVAEEGLDVPDCNLIIRFDLYATLIQYIQSKGRARHLNSRYIHMIEAGNQEHANIVKEVKRNENILQKFCEALPQDRRLTDNDVDLDRCLAKEKNRRYRTPAGALLDYKMSLAILANFVDSLPHSGEGNLKADFVISIQNKDFICEVILPEESPVRGATGRPATTKQVAKCSAAFEACLLLVKGKYLDTWLLPTITKQLPVMNNARLAVDEKKKEAYDMRTKPTAWSQGGMPEELFATLLVLSNPEALDRPSQPLVLLTRSRIPELPSFFLHFGNDRHSPVQCISLAQPLQVSPETVEQINRFTLCFFEDIFSKGYESDPTKIPYFIVPATGGRDTSVELAPTSIIAWDIVRSVFEYENKWGYSHWENKCWKTESDEFFVDKFIVDPFDGARKMWSKGVTRAYKPLDPVPPNTAPRKGQRKNNKNIIEYSCSLWKSAREKRMLDENQRVFEAEVVSLRRNLLDEFDAPVEDATPTKCFIILEALKVSAIPTTVVAMSLVFPAIIHRIESYLIALEAFDLIHLKVRPELALEAFTKDSDNTSEHDVAQVNFQRGMGKNYERLEFLGDCFLKMATSISMYGIHPGSNEGDFHVDRMLMICNKNLKNNVIKLGLYEYIRSASFSRRAWYPEGLVLKKGKTATAPNTHKLGDKSLADVGEASIGAALLNSHETKNMDDAVRAVTELVSNELHSVTCYDDYYKLYTKPKYQIAPVTELQRDMAIQLEQKHPYHFKYPRLARSAFTHPTYPFMYEQIPSYQRLEFLGDSLLDMACVNFLFHSFPDKDPQWLTEHKMAMVSNQFLAALCISMGFNTHLLALHQDVLRQVATYAMEITEAQKLAEDDAERAGKPREDFARDYWTQVRHPPKCLGDMIEAYLGAIFVDSEYDYTVVERFFDMQIKPYFTDMSIYDSFANKQPTTFLSKFLQINMGCNNWRPVAMEIKPADGAKSTVLVVIIIHDQVIADAEAESSRYAKVGAAKKAMAILDGLPIMEFKEKYGCNCRPEDVDEHDGIPGG